jgi:hypothetical protein
MEERAMIKNPWRSTPARNEATIAATLRAIEDMGDHEPAIQTVLGMRLTYEEALTALIAALTAARIYHHKLALHRSAHDE